MYLTCGWSICVEGSFEKASAKAMAIESILQSTPVQTVQKLTRAKYLAEVRVYVSPELEAPGAIIDAKRSRRRESYACRR